MGHFSKEGFEHFKSILHPDLRANADHYFDNGMYRFPVYHGCGLRNRNGTNKLIDYKRGYQCLFPADKKYWKPYSEISKDKIRQDINYTRYMSTLGLNYYAKTKGQLWYDWDEQCYKPKSAWFKGNNPGNCPL